MSNSDNANYNNNNINNLVNCELFNSIRISKHTLNILYSKKYIFPIFINI